MRYQRPLWVIRWCGSVRRGGAGRGGFGRAAGDEPAAAGEALACRSSLT